MLWHKLVLSKPKERLDKDESNLFLFTSLLDGGFFAALFDRRFFAAFFNSSPFDLPSSRNFFSTLA